MGEIFLQYVHDKCGPAITICFQSLPMFWSEILCLSDALDGFLHITPLSEQKVCLCMHWTSMKLAILRSLLSATVLDDGVHFVSKEEGRKLFSMHW